MKRSKYSAEQVTFALRQHEAGTPAGDICRQLGISEATFYNWKKKYAHLSVTELRELRQLREENSPGSRRPPAPPKPRSAGRGCAAPRHAKGA